MAKAPYRELATNIGQTATIQRKEIAESTYLSGIVSSYSIPPCAPIVQVLYNSMRQIVMCVHAGDIAAFTVPLYAAKDSNPESFRDTTSTQRVMFGKLGGIRNVFAQEETGSRRYED
jgi:hypothetical protein